jgi:hypothetical protein
MATLQQYIDESPADLDRVQNYAGGMNIQLYHCSLIKFCNESNTQTVEELISNVDIDEIIDFPLWSEALDLTRHNKILTHAYEYIKPEFKANIRCAPINWERVVTRWLSLLDSGAITEQKALFVLFAMPAVKQLDEMYSVRLAWEKRLEEIWANHKPDLPSSTKASKIYTPDSSKYDISTPYDHLSHYKQDEIDERIRRKKVAVYDYEDDQSTNTISYKQ